MVAASHREVRCRLVAEAQFYPRFALVVRDTANPVIETYPEAALGLFFTADHAIYQSRGHALELFIRRARIEIECLGVLRCCELDLVAALVDPYAVKFSRAPPHCAVLCACCGAVLWRHELIA